MTQDRLRRAAELQAVAWQAHQAAHDAIAAIKRDLERGATVESGGLEFHEGLGMVRTKKVRMG